MKKKLKIEIDIYTKPNRKTIAKFARELIEIFERETLENNHLTLANEAVTIVGRFAYTETPGNE
jgi:hypothetical protein